jgi:hypothetical protein
MSLAVYSAAGSSVTFTLILLKSGISCAASAGFSSEAMQMMAIMSSIGTSKIRDRRLRNSSGAPRALMMGRPEHEEEQKVRFGYIGLNLGELDERLNTAKHLTYRKLQGKIDYER